MNKVLIMTVTVLLLIACAAPTPTERNERTVFVTSETFISDLGGLQGADEKCQVEADASSSIVPSGTYLAWLSDGIDSPDTRFTKSSHPYILPDGTMIAKNYADLTDGSILHALNIDATGKPVGLKLLWTDTMADGTYVQSFAASAEKNSCNAWSGDLATYAHVIVGSTIDKTSSWTFKHLDSCNYRGRQKHPLACFQQ